jgi:hypothetical protein
MPYINQHRRQRLAEGRDAPRNTGELNYVITNIINEYYKYEGGYSSINDVLGALEGAKLEFYRRAAAPYEDQKIQENGDVY